MRITFVFDGLFPAAGRPARHVEALVRRFLARGHRVSVVTTSGPESREPDGIPVLYLAHVPASPSAKDAGLLVKKIVKHLQQENSELLFAESLSPLSALALKGAASSGVPTIVRVLADRDGVIHDFARSRRGSQRLVRKRIAALLEHASMVAASSPRCAELLEGLFEGPVQVIEKCVDLSVFKSGSSSAQERKAFLARHEARGRRLLLYGREQPALDSLAELFPLLPLLASYAADVVLMVLGEVDEKAFLERAGQAGAAEFVRCGGPLTGRDAQVALDAASLFLVPPSSAASGRELLEAMAMACPLALFEGSLTAAEDVASPGENAFLLPAKDTTQGARLLGELLQDEERLQALAKGALETARKHDLAVAIEQVERLAESVLGLQSARERGQKDPADAPLGSVHKEASESKTMATDKMMDKTSRGGREPVQKARSRRGNGKTPESGPAEEPKSGEALPAGDAAPGTTREESFTGVQFVEQEETGSRRVRSRRHPRSKGRSRGNDEVEELGQSTGTDVLEVTSNRAGHRQWDLDPGLTLKDLMPFLRPPKNLLILGLSSGSGHARVAAALGEGFKHVDRNLLLRQVDLLELLSKRYRPPFVRAWLEDLSRLPALFGRCFETSEGVPLASLPQDLEEVLEKVFDGKLDELVVDKRPDLLVCTHWLPLRHLEKLAQEDKLKAEVVAVVSDPLPHSFWVSSVVSHYLVPGEHHRPFFMGLGVDPSAITETGLPISPAFLQKAERGRVLGGLGLSAKNPVLLLRPGGIGDIKRIQGVVERLLGLGQDMNLVVLAGGNDRLREKLEELKPPSGVSLKALGFVQNIPDLMGASDLLITRAQGHTVAESLAAGLPLLLLRPAPGMEERLADLLLQKQVARKIQGEEDLEAAVLDLFKNRRRLREMQEAARQQGKGAAARLAVERIVKLAR